MGLLQDNLLAALAHWEPHLGRQVEVQIQMEVGEGVVGCSAAEHLNLGGPQELVGVVVGEGQMMDAAKHAGCPDLVLAQSVVCR